MLRFTLLIYILLAILLAGISTSMAFVLGATHAHELLALILTVCVVSAPSALFAYRFAQHKMHKA